LLPTAEQTAGLAEHCRHARYVWNLAVEQQQHWQPGRRAPGYNEQCAQLTAARAEQIPAAYTSQRCSVCGHVAPGNRKSQAVFECEACTTGPCNADLNAARNIAAGRAVTARGDLGAGWSTNREPQLFSPAA
jgi:hypothetical protein